jgi:hypothetical protein
MKKRVLITMALVLIFAVGTLTGCGTDKADAVWTNGSIYTADETTPLWKQLP